MLKGEPISRIVFDLDGTLLDTGRFIIEAFTYAFQALELGPLPLEKLKSKLGQPLTTCYEILAPSSDIEALCAAHCLFEGQHLDLVLPFPNTNSTLRALKKQGGKMAIVTSRLKPSAMAILEKTDLRDMFEIIIGPEDVPRKKPFPDGIKKALREMSITPANAIMVGDSREDICAGKNAKVRTVAALYGFEGKTLKDQNPDGFISDIGELVSLIQ